MVQGTWVAVLVVIVAPLVAAIGVIGSEWLSAPSLAEHRRRARRPGERWDRLEKVAVWVVAIAIAVAFVVVLVDLWIHRSTY